MKNKVIQGDCLEKLKELEDNSVDAVVTDPPYGLSFMGKKWDYDVPSVEIWEECLRVLKPGGYLLAFAGTRTQHRMAVRIEDAGFEIRDMIAWVYASGFPKSLNIGKQINSLETKEWSEISKAFDNIDKKSIMEVWKSNVKPAEIQLSKSLTEVGNNTPKNFFVPDIAVLYHRAEVEVAYAPVFIAELSSAGLTPLNEESGLIVQESADTSTIQLQDRAKFAVKLSQNLGVSQWSIFTAQCNVKEWLRENTEVNHRVDEALKTLRGNKKYSNEEITNVLCAILTDTLKHTILNQSKTFQNLDTKSQMDYASVINVIITEYTAENLISNTVDILKSKAVDKLQGNEREVVGEKDINSIKTLQKFKEQDGRPTKTDFSNIEQHITKGTSEWEGWGTALKPALEPITVARKPLSEKTVAENCLKWGVGGINIDGCRVGTEVMHNALAGNKAGGNSLNMSATGMPQDADGTTANGRFPANLLHDGSDEVVSLFPNSKGAIAPVKNKVLPTTSNTDNYKKHSLVGDDGISFINDSGSASRFFYCAKSSHSERTNKGTITNGHPTIKPIALMEYLVKLVSREGAVVLDPFAGSGSTLIACKNLNRQYIGIEREADYIEIINKRLQ